MENQRGFTLIELLVVIAILAIIMLISIPVILNLINKTRIEAAQDSAYGIRDAAKIYFHSNLDDYSEITFFCSKSNNGCISDDKRLDFDGIIPDSGTIKIKNDGLITGTDFVIDGYSCNTFHNNDQIICGNSNTNPTNPGGGSGSSPSIQPISIGDEKIIRDEHFMVISTNSSQIALLSKYCLNVGNEYTENDVVVNGGIQDSHVLGFNSGNPKYGNIAYSDVDGFINTYKNYLNQSSNIVSSIRLLTVSEATSLGCSGNSCNDSQYDWFNSASFWLQDTDSNDEDYAWTIDTNNLFTTDKKSETRYYCARPVIIVNTSSLNSN